MTKREFVLKMQVSANFIRTRQCMAAWERCWRHAARTVYSVGQLIELTERTSGSLKVDSASDLRWFDAAHAGRHLTGWIRLEWSNRTRRVCNESEAWGRPSTSRALLVDTGHCSATCTLLLRQTTPPLNSPPHVQTNRPLYVVADPAIAETS